MSIDQPIRVLQIIGIPIGGVEAVIMNYYRHIDRNKIQFDFVFHNNMESVNAEEIQVLGGKIYRVTPYNQNPIKFMSEIYRIAKMGNYKIIHNNMNTLAWFGLLPAWLADVPIRILHNHSTSVPSETKRNVLKAIFKPIAQLFANRYWACSQSAADWMYGKNTGKDITIIKNAIDIEKFSYNIELRDDIRRQLHIEKNFVIGNIGRFMYQKNQAFLIDVFSAIYRNNPDARLLLIGGGPLKTQLEEQVKKLNLCNSVIFVDNCKDVYKYYSAMDIFMFPSRYEGLGVVILEAQANGLPVIMSRAVPEEAIVNQEGITYIDSFDINKWAQSFINHQKRLEVNKEVFKDRGYDIRKESQNLCNIYLEIVKNNQI